MPKISVIVPVYNVEPYLCRCVDSILNQTFTDFELILVDDGSPDGSPVICDEYAEKDSRVSVIHKENGGAATARNAGLNIATGGYIGFIDGDDYIHPQFYEILLRIAQSTASDIAACHYQFVSPEAVCNFELCGEDIYHSLGIVPCDGILMNFDEYCRRVSLISPCMRLCNRKLFDGLRFEEGFIEEDSMLLLPLLEKANKIAKVNIPLYCWVINPTSVTRIPFSAKRFAFVHVSYLRVKFFERRKDYRLARIFRKEYMNRVVAFYRKAKQCNLVQEYNTYLQEYRQCFWKYIFFSGFCKMEVLMHMAFYFHIQIWEKIYQKLQPVDEIYLR